MILKNDNNILTTSNKLLNTTNSIIQNDLLYWFDASRKDSYPGSGLVWYDISGHGYTANWNSFTSYNWNSFTVVDGQCATSVPVVFPNPGGSYGTVNDLTFSTWFKGQSTLFFQVVFHINPGNNSQNFVFDLNDPDSGGGNRTIWTYWNDGGFPASTLSVGAYMNNPINPGHSDLLNGQWINYTFRRKMDTPYTDHFVNGVKINSVNRNGTQTDPIYGNVMLLGSSFRFDGEVGSYYGYSRALSDYEIYMNYMADKNNFT